MKNTSRAFLSLAFCFTTGIKEVGNLVLHVGARYPLLTLTIFTLQKATKTGF